MRNSDAQRTRPRLLAVGHNRQAAQSARARRRRSGFTLVELMVVVATISVLISLAVPSFRRSIEQSHADIASANLRAIWTAERLYWLENRTFTTALGSLDVDASLASATSPYTYAITSADANSFAATATRAGSTMWSGSFSISQSGSITGTITASGETAITPGFQD
jgi:prepilin-type N-terminal cleavage/methylation domain-containing protein